ncbi:hypothetical protein V5P93_005643 [Actinokineospora auranticolor]|nr:hypothetical protein [Actinokineospora auranticolor]
MALVLAGRHFDTLVREPLGLWSRWLTGEQLGGERLWGWPLLAWGRTGKALQFVAGLTVVLDLVGPDRLRAFGAELRGQSWRRLADKLEVPVMMVTAVTLVMYYLLVFLTIFAREAMAGIGVTPALLSGPVGAVLALLVVLGVGFLLLRVVRKQGGQTRRGIMAHAERLPLYLVGAAPIALWITATRFLLLPAVNGLARAFDRTHPGYPLRWAAFALFVVGFQFDLLAS